MRYLRAMRRLRVLLDGGFDSLAIEQAGQTVTGKAGGS
jgi:hypothetical protein